MRAEAAALQERVDQVSGEEPLDDKMPSLLVAINGGLVKVDNLADSSISGQVILPLASTAEAQPGAWQVVTYLTPEGSRRSSDAEVAFLERLKAEGRVQRNFNWMIFTSGDSREPELAGIRGALVGTALTLLVTLLLSLPIGVLAAIYLEEFAPKNKATELIEININNLAAVPSIVFGLLGLAVFLNFFGFPRSAPLVGGLVLALLVLPTIIIASRAALKAVPPSIKEAALGVGASHQQAVFHHVLPLAMPGIMTGTIIGMAHALGETAPLADDRHGRVHRRRARCADRRGHGTAGAGLSLVGSAGARLQEQDGCSHHRAARLLVRHERSCDLSAQEIRAALVSSCEGECLANGCARELRYSSSRSAALTATKIIARDVNVYYGEKHALKGVDVDIPERSVTAFIGPSGCGKSTFLRCINRMNDTIPICRVTGKITIDKTDIYDRSLDVVQLRARVGMVFQKPNPFPKSIFENVAYGPRIHGLAATKAELDEKIVLQPAGAPACSRR